MAKQAMSAKVGEKSVKTGSLVKVHPDMDDAVLLRFNAEGTVLEFDGENLRLLPDPVTQALSHENARRYWMAFGEKKAREKSTKRPEKLEILDPLVGHEEARLSFKPVGDAGKEFLKRYHVSWLFCTTASGMKQQGYSEVTDKDPLEVGISSNASGYYLTKDLQGRDELLLMKLDKTRWNQHERAVAEKSQAAIRGARSQFEGELDKVSKGQVKPMRETEEDQMVEQVRVTADTVDRAFVADKK
jgi:hypothetical protein